jgi:hypothetical protein
MDIKISKVIWLRFGLFLAIIMASASALSGQDSIDAQQFDAFDRGRAASLSGLIIRNLALANDERVDLILSRAEPFAPDAVLYRDGAIRGPLVSDRIYFQGTSLSDGHAQVSLSIGSDGSVRGVLADDRGHWRLLSLQGRIQATLVSDEPVPGTREHDHFQCGLNADIRQRSREAQRLFEVNHPPTRQIPRGTTDRYRVRVAYDTTNRFVSLFANGQQAIDYLGDLTNHISLMYIRELNTEIVVSSTVLRGADEPWDLNGDLLDQLGNYWNDPTNTVDQTRTLAHLVDAGPSQGVAWVGALCGDGFDYGVSQGLGTEFDPEADPQGWSFSVVAHELGHNFGSDHTHCYTPVIDQCYNGEAGNGCWGGAESLPGPANEAPGTIMSYCHLLAPGFGNNISVTLGRDHGFGVNPERVPDTMRAHVLARAAVGGPRCPQLVEVGTSFLVSTSVQGDGTVSPTSANVPEGETTNFTLTPAAGADLISADGCGGNLNANTFTTGPVTAACTVNVVFSDVQAPDPLCAVVNQAIPDNSSQGISSTLPVMDFGEIDKLEVSLDIEHTWVGDIIVDLEHEPTGTTVRLVNRPGTDGGGFGCSGEDIKVILDDDAGPAIQDDCQSTSAFPQERYRPANALSEFTQLTLAGDWILTVSDNADGDTGELLQWCLVPTITGVEIFIDRFEQ